VQVTFSAKFSVVFSDDGRHNTSYEFIDLPGGSADVACRVAHLLKINLAEGDVGFEPAD
jgi:hypothetical protein